LERLNLGGADQTLHDGPDALDLRPVGGKRAAKLLRVVENFREGFATQRQLMLGG
jgi:hypothetical protein